ncbi:MAG: right-handed parallel beta-helix repeat-containing protein [Candidatus Bathyarchaeota archaeon]|nr:MAG: right-handed parallel beta-helix repeat-containing protein [Candidatus Bathyarchaeota archaeon]
MKKLAPLLLFVLLLGFFVLLVRIERVKADSPIYIRPDGSIDPTSAPIERVGNLYTLAGNLSTGLVIQRGNMLLDGNGYMINGSGSGNGVNVQTTINVQIQNLTIQNVNYGVFIDSSPGTIILGNTIAGNTYGVLIDSSPDTGILGNTITSGSYGILIDLSSNVQILGNTIVGDTYGVLIRESPTSIVSINQIHTTMYSLLVEGSELSHYLHSIDVTNLVNGKPIYYLTNQTNLTLNPVSHPEIGYLALVNCSNVQVENLTLVNDHHGLLIAYSKSLTITNNLFADNTYGLQIVSSENATITNNLFANNTYGLQITASANLPIINNPFTNNTYGLQITSSESLTITNNLFADNSYGLQIVSSKSSIITNSLFRNNTYGLHITSSPYSTVSTNQIVANEYGAYYDNSSHTTLSKNNITNNENGAYLLDSHHSTITANTLVNDGGISLQEFCRNNTVIENFIENCSGEAIYFGWYSERNTASNNTITNSTYGVRVHVSSDHTISGNKIANCTETGIHIFDSSRNVVSRNAIDNCGRGSRMSKCWRTTFSDNTITNCSLEGLLAGGGVYYDNILRNRISNCQDGIYFDDSAWVPWRASTCVDNTISNCTRGIRSNRATITISGNTITNCQSGIWSAQDNSIKISGNDISNIVQHGIYIAGNRYTCIISDNRITDCSQSGIWLGARATVSNNVVNNCYNAFWLQGRSGSILSGNAMSNSWTGVGIDSSRDNQFVHNNFLNNTYHAYVQTPDYPNLWDNGCEGNYWSGFDVTDVDPDAIGDIPYIIDGNNTDHYPLIAPSTSFNTAYGYAVFFVSNSTISNLNFSLSSALQPLEATLKFNVAGAMGTQGYVRVSIPKDLINGSYLVRFNGVIITDVTFPRVRELVCQSDIYTYFYIEYAHSDHVIEISGTTVIPEFPSHVILPLFMSATLLAAVVFRRKYS